MMKLLKLSIKKDGLNPYSNGTMYLMFADFREPIVEQNVLILILMEQCI